MLNTPSWVKWCESLRMVITHHRHLCGSRDIVTDCANRVNPAPWWFTRTVTHVRRCSTSREGGLKTTNCSWMCPMTRGFNCHMGWENFSRCLNVQKYMWNPDILYTDPSRLALTNARKFVDQQSQNTSDSECFDAANQQIWVHLWGPCVMGVYYIMVTIKILRKRILINRIFDNRRCQIILWWQLKEPLCRAWFGCSPSGYTPSDDYMEFPGAI